MTEKTENRFEECFEEFLDSREYDAAEEALFRLVREAYIAGWRAAGGEDLPEYVRKKIK